MALEEDQDFNTLQWEVSVTLSSNQPVIGSEIIITETKLVNSYHTIGSLPPPSHSFVYTWFLLFSCSNFIFFFRSFPPLFSLSLIISLKTMCLYVYMFLMRNSLFGCGDKKKKKRKRKWNIERLVSAIRQTWVDSWNQMDHQHFLFVCLSVFLLFCFV